MPPPNSQPVPQACTRVPSVLLIEDQADLRRLLVRGLERHGLHVVACENVTAARLALSTYVFDVVVTDATLDLLDDGLDLARDTRISQPEVPVIVVSGSRGIVTRAQSVNASGVLQKPVTAAQVVEAVKSHIRFLE